MTRSSSARACSATTTQEAHALDHLSGDALADALTLVDWSGGACEGLGRAMARRDVDLATALCVFFGGAPERFNYLPKSHVPKGYRPILRHLDNICLRINSGFYMPVPRVHLACRGDLDHWLDYQRADRIEGRCGRWVLDEALLGPLFDLPQHQPPQQSDPEQASPKPARGLRARMRVLRWPFGFGRS